MVFGRACERCRSGDNQGVCKSAPQSPGAKTVRFVMREIEFRVAFKVSVEHFSAEKCLSKFNLN